LGHPEAFATVVTERMMVYALGRGLDAADMPVVRRIVRRTAQNGYRLSNIVNEIIESAPFQMRTRLEPAQQSNTVARATTTGADMVAGDTAMRSIEVGTEDMGTAVGACDGFPCTFFNTLAWRSDTSPLPVGINPRVTFERMFGEAGTPDQRTARLKERQSLLDSVTSETKRLKSS